MQKTSTGYIIFNFQTASYVTKRDKITTSYDKHLECAYVYYNLDEANHNLKQLRIMDSITGNENEFHDIIKVKVTIKTVK
jgi:hypothetical protein